MAVRSSDQISIVDLTDGYSVILTNDSYTFPGNTSTALAGSTTTTIIAMCGATQVAASVDLNAVVKPTGVTVTKDTDVTQPTLTIAVSTAVTAGGTVDILQNEKYYGSALLQKTYTTDFLTHRKKKNDGELPQYHIENSHPAIVTKEQWDLVQVELERRSRMPGRFSPKGPLGSRLVCADCGAFFGAKTWHSSDPYKTVIWRCNDKYRPGIERKSGGEKCCTGHVTEEKVMAAFSKIVAGLIARKPEVLETCEVLLHELLDSSATDEKRKRLDKEGDAIAKEIEALVERQARGTVEGFAEKYQELEKRYRRVEDKLKAVAADRQDRAYRAKQAELFLETMKQLSDEAKLESTELFMALVDKVIVGDGLTFILRDGSTRGVRF